MNRVSGAVRLAEKAFAATTAAYRCESAKDGRGGTPGVPAATEAVPVTSGALAGARRRAVPPAVKVAAAK
jgi:hypothetical protein